MYRFAGGLLMVPQLHLCKGKDKEALFNVTYLKQTTDTYLPYSIFLCTNPLIRASAREMLVPFYTFGIVRPGFEPTTSRSESGRCTN